MILNGRNHLHLFYNWCAQPLTRLAFAFSSYHHNHIFIHSENHLSLSLCVHQKSQYHHHWRWDAKLIGGGVNGLIRGRGELHPPNHRTLSHQWEDFQSESSISQYYHRKPLTFHSAHFQGSRKKTGILRSGRPSGGGHRSQPDRKQMRKC